MIAVPDENDRSRLLVEHPLGRGNIFVEPSQGLLDDADVVAVPGKHIVDTAPGGTVDERAMYQDDGGLWLHGGLRR